VLAFIALVGAMGVFVGLLVFRPRTLTLLPEGTVMNDRVRRMFSSTESAPPPEAGVVNPSEDHTVAEIGELMPAEEIGEQVTTILASAKQAARQLREAARREAEQLRNEAKEEAAAVLERANADLRGVREESDRLREEAGAYSKDTRRAADRDAAETRRKFAEEAERRLAEASHEADGIVRAAKKRSQELANEAGQRRKALVREAERSEARLHQVLDVFRAMTSQLEELLENRRAEAPAEELDEALKPRGGDPST
jgi:cell division septum initiation protein DivIVA